MNQLSAMYEWSFNPMEVLADFGSWVHWPESTHWGLKSDFFSEIDFTKNFVKLIS